FDTRLDVPQTDLADAVAAVRASATGERATEYRRRLGAEDPVEMAVLIQEMVHPVASGVAFSRNPMTGLNEVVVEAVEGRGDRLVDDGVTPDRWTHRWGSWIEQPESGVIDDATASRIVATTRQIAADYGRPVDLEWVWDGSKLWWVQLRPITGLRRRCLLQSDFQRGDARDHQASRVVGERADGQPRLGRVVHRSCRAQQTPARRPGEGVRLSVVLQHGSDRRHLWTARHAP
ncbi:MAG: hypothetical protein KJN71_05670, partial [Acidimicrobiia bacterium]|nr:hypothetical protein [Acidimicrobiia bacterium]